MVLSPEVQLAVDELQATFDSSEVSVVETGDGGAWVRVGPLTLGPQYVQDDTWASFLVTFQYPAADVYPHFMRPDLARKDGQPLGQAFQNVQWGPATDPGVQVSRATRQIDPAVDTAALKLLKVLDFVNSA